MFTKKTLLIKSVLSKYDLSDVVLFFVAPFSERKDTNQMQKHNVNENSSYFKYFFIINNT